MGSSHFEAFLRGFDKSGGKLQEFSQGDN